MAWRDQLREASFRGVAFKVEGHDRELGRRLEVHEYPFRDRAYPEDLGARTGRYQLDAFVVGADYMAARDALAKALNQGGAGTLVHPYLGTLQVVVDVARQSERADEGGMAVFSIAFVDAADPSTPTVRADSAAVSAVASDAAKAAIAAGFMKRYKAAALSPFNQGEAARLVGSAGQALSGVADAAGVQGASLYKIRTATGLMTSQADYLALRPSELAGRVLDVVTTIGGAAGSAGASLKALSGLSRFGGDVPAVIGQSIGRIVQRSNQAALIGMVRQSGLALAARATTAMAFAAYDDAVRVRDDLAGLVDDAAVEAGDAGDDAGYQGLTKLRLAVWNDLTARGGSLARISEVSPVQTEPSLVLAYRLYGDAGRADEIAARNKLAHPGFAPGGSPLQVLTDV